MNDSSIQDIIDWLNDGGCLVFPTTTLPGLGCYLNSNSLDELFKLKNRSPSMPVSIAVANLHQARKIVEVDEDAIQLFNSFPESTISIILPAIKPLDERLGGKNVAIRIVSHPIAKKLIEKTGPITATSANISGQECAPTCKAAGRALGIAKFAIIEGNCPGGSPSTLIKLTKSIEDGKRITKAIVMREGVIPVQDVMTWSPTSS